MVSNVALSTSVVLLAAAVVLGQDLAVPNGEGGGLATSGGGGGGRARTAPTRVQQVTLYPATEPGGRMEVNPPFLEMIEKEPGERPVDSDLKAVNRMLCKIAGGSHDENYDCRNRLGEDMAAFQFATVEQLGAVHENEEAMTRIFRAPLVRYIEGPKGGVVQLVALGMGDQAGEWGRSWNRDAEATRSYLKVFLPRPRSQVPIDFMGKTEQLRFQCDPCFFHSSALRTDIPFQNKLLEFFHTSHQDCSGTGHCIKAHVVIVDDEDVEGDEELLRTLAAHIWDETPAATTEKFRELCGEPLSEGFVTSLYSEAKTLWSTDVALVPAEGASSAPKKPAAPAPDRPRRPEVHYGRAGCGLLRERFNKQQHARWRMVERRRMTGQEQSVVDFLRGPIYQAMMKGTDTEDLVEKAFRRSLGMEQVPPKKELLDAGDDHLDRLLAAVKQAAAEETRDMAYWASIATIGTYAVDKFLWPGLYVGEKFLLTMSFALAVPLATLAMVCLLATLLLGRCPSVLSLCPRLTRRRAPEEDKKAHKALADPLALSVRPAQLYSEDAQGHGSDFVAARGSLMLHTKADMRKITDSKGIFLSPQKTRPEEDRMFKSLNKEQIVDMILQSEKGRGILAELGKRKSGLVAQEPSSAVGASSKGAGAAAKRTRRDESASRPPSSRSGKLAAEEEEEAEEAEGGDWGARGRGPLARDKSREPVKKRGRSPAKPPAAAPAPRARRAAEDDSEEMDTDEDASRRSPPRPKLAPKRAASPKKAAAKATPKKTTPKKTPPKKTIAKKPSPSKVAPRRSTRASLSASAL